MAADKEGHTLETDERQCDVSDIRPRVMMSGKITESNKLNSSHRWEEKYTIDRQKMDLHF